MELGRSALEKYVLTEENIFSSIDILSRLNVRKVLSMSWMDQMCLDKCVIPFLK